MRIRRSTAAAQPLRRPRGLDTSFLGRSQRPPAGIGDGGRPRRSSGAEAVPLGAEPFAVVSGYAGGYVFVFEPLEVRMEHLVVRAMEVVCKSNHQPGGY